MLLALSGVACAQDDPEVEDPAATTDVDSEELGEDGFALTGTVLQARAGVQPETDDAEASPGTDGTEDEATASPAGDEDDADTEEDADVGGMAIRPDDEDAATNLDDCETQEDAYIVYYDEETEFPDGAADEEGFPESLEGTRLTVTGTHEMTEGEDGGCILHADEVEEAEALDETDEGVTGTTGDDGTAGTDEGTDGTDEGTGDESPAPSASPTGEVTYDFFPEGAPGSIGEGTASPDPCEGQDACLEEN